MRADDLRITAVIPTFNRAPLLGRCIESALGQSRKPDEIVVVDDGSTDETADVVARYDDVVYVRQQNAGPSAARNRGAEAATGAWVAWLDSDDVWLPEHLERMADTIAATEGAADVYFGDLLRPVDGREVSHWARCDFDPPGPYSVAGEPLDWVLLPRRPHMLQASVIRRDSFTESGGLWPRLRMNEDGHLFIRLSARGRVCAVPGAGARMTDDAPPDDRLFGGRSRTADRAYQEELVEMYADLFERLDEIPTQHRAVIRRRLRNAHVRLAKIDKASGQTSGALRHLVGAVRTDPIGLAKQIAQRFERRRQP